jgi:multimeric flavodoxin WrbA
MEQSKKGLGPIPPGSVLGLIGSPRKLGNCEILVKDVASRLGLVSRLDLLRLPSLNILGCKACYQCVMDKPCPQKDDMHLLLEHIAQAEALIIAAPVYFLDVHSIFKRILDRGFLFFNYIEKTFGKPCVLASVYGMDQRIGAAPHTLRVFASFLGLQVKAGVSLKAALPGEILQGENQEELERLAEALSSRDNVSREDGCPYCGCEVARMEKGLFTCTVCHGTFSFDNTGNRVRLKEGGIFGKPEQMLTHKKWLQGMKDRFIANRKETLGQLIPFKSMGNWILTPP